MLELTGKWALALLAASSTIVAIVAIAARRRLRRAHDRSRIGERALDAMPHAVFVVDALRPGRPNLHVNAAYAALTGYGPAEAVGANFDALSIFADAAAVAALDGRDGHDEPVSTAQRVDVRRRDGTVFPAKLELSVLPRNHGGRYIVGLLERLQSGERLADRPEGRPAVAPTRLHSATDAFLSWLIHELRSPLNACVMWLDVLALSPEPDKLAKAVEALKRNLARQARLVSDLNDATKLTSSSSELRHERFDLVALLKDGLEAWRPLAAGKQLVFNSRVDLGAAPIDGDSHRLSQAINHLMENAIGSTPTGGRLDLRVHAAGANYIMEVEDTGAALSAEDAANLFIPLWRAPTSAKGRTGLGLGLAIAHRVVVQHGGTLSATNGVSGARFVLTLPISRSGAIGQA